MTSDHVGLAPSDAAEQEGVDERDALARACEVLIVTYAIDAAGAADVLRVCAQAVGLEVQALAHRIVRGVGEDSAPSYITVDALLMEVGEPVPGGC
ncbi:MAG: hypothetical protein ACRDUX_33805 [Mycobacterium sp.]